MPLIPPSQASLVPTQVFPTSFSAAAYVQQMNFGQMQGRVLTEGNPDAGAMAPQWINDAARVIYDRRCWFGLFVKGQLICPGATTAGSATVVTGSNTVQGTNTSWNNSLVGQQFRIGYNNPIYTIVAVDPVGQVLQLELPWGGQSTTSGYFIVQYYYNLGPNIKYLKLMTNMQLGYKFQLHWTQDGLDAIDPWRQNQNWPWAAAPMPLDPAGNYLIELYPASWIQQAFPFLAYIQPPNLAADTDSLPPYIRTDVVLKRALAEAKVWRGPKDNPYYDAQDAARLRMEFETELNQMALADENLYRQNVTAFGEDISYYTPGGNLWAASHAVSASSLDGSWGDF
jgi:hypothetical protein